MMRKITFIVNSRSNWALIRPILRAIPPNFKLAPSIILGSAATESRFQDIQQEISDLNWIDQVFQAPSDIAGHNTMALSLAPLIAQTDAFLRHLQPDAVFIVGDRFETMAAAYCARMANIPLLHLQGGEKSGCVDDYVRNALSCLADVHFPATQIAARRLKNRFAHTPDRVYHVGCPSLDVIHEAQPRLDYLERALLLHGTGATISLRVPYHIVLQHPDTTEQDVDPLAQIEPTIHAVQAMNIQTIWLYPNIDAGSDVMGKRIRQFAANPGNLRVRFIMNLPPNLFVNLLRGAGCLIGNSSAGVRLCPILGKPAVNIGNRQKWREHVPGQLLPALYDAETLENAIRAAWRMKPKLNPLYGDGRSGERIVQHLLRADLL